MAANDIAICNSALAKLGSLRITTMADSTEHARLVNEQYNKVRKALLASHPWNFATKRVALVATTAPAFGFTKAFALPNDYLRALEVDLDTEAEWAIEGLTLVCDSAEVYLKYLYDVTTTTIFTSLFDELFALTLAHDICYALTQSASLKDQLYRELQRCEAKVRSFDAQEGTGKRVTARRLFNSRYGRI